MASGFYDLLAWFGWKSAEAPAVGGLYWIDESQGYMAGRTEGQLFEAGTDEGDSFTAGTEAGE